MWDLLKKSTKDCAEFQDLLEHSAGGRGNPAGLEELMKSLPLSQREHVAHCARCRETGEDFFAVREIFRDVESLGSSGGPSFVARVMEAITSREREIALLPSTWSAVPRLASRLAWAGGILLLVGSTWLYERSAAAPQKEPGAASQEYLFEAPQPAPNQDDVLVSMAEKNP